MLLTTLVGLTLLAGMAITLQVRTLATVAVLARLEDRHDSDLAVAAIYAMTTAQLVGQGPRPPLDGTLQQRSVNGQTYDVRLKDVEGLVDLYLAPAEVLTLLPVDGLDLVASRDAALAGMSAGDRFLAKSQTLVRFGLDPVTRQALEPLVTQYAQTGAINPDLAPVAIRARAAVLTEQDIAGGQIAEIAITRAAP